MSYLEWAVVILSLLTAFYIWATWHYDTFKRWGIPYVKPVPLLGSHYKFWLGRQSVGDSSLHIYNSAKGKTVVGYFDFRSPTLMIRDPNVLRMITTKDFDHFVDHRRFTDEDDSLFGKSLFLLTGARWKTMRNILTPAFTSSKMKSMFVLVNDCGKQLGDYLEEKSKAEKTGSVVIDTMDLFKRYSSDVIGTSAFGVQCDSLKDPKNEFYEIGKEATDFGNIRSMFTFVMSSAAPKLLKLLDMPVTPHRVNDFFQALVRDTMRTREREGIVRPDMIHLLMQARKGTLKGDDGDEQGTEETRTKAMNLTDEDITAQAFLFFFAGLETSSTLHCFLCHLLAVHPDVQRTVQDEIDAILRGDGGRLTYEGVVQRTKYLDMVISETLRLWPAVLEIDRLCVKDYTIPATASTPAVEIKKGQEISIPVFAIQRDPEFYPDPERFDPERFSDENKDKINNFAYLPFGVGPRACIGNRFALMSTKILTVSLLSRFNLEVSSKTPTSLRFKKNTFNTTVEGGFWLSFTPRTNTAVK